VHVNIVLSKVYDHAAALKLRARIYHNKEHYKKSVIDYTALIDKYPEDREMRYGRGLARQNLAHYSLAIEDYQEALKLPDKETNTAFFKIDSKDKMATGISTMSSMNWDILNNIGLCYFEMGDHFQALNYFNEALGQNPDSAHVLINRAKCYEAQDELELAVKDYKAILASNPEHIIASFNLLQIEKSLQNNDQALESLDLFIENNPNIADGYESRGLYHFEENQYEKALSDFEAAVRLEPSSIEYKFNLALALEKNEKFELAELQFLEVIELDHRHSAAFFNLANMQFKSGRYEDAITYYTMARHHDTNNINILYNRALAYFKIEHLKEACADMQEVLKVKPLLAEEFCKMHCTNP
jgi:tetratricopeptide (TPR) repeat protein